MYVNVHMLAALAFHTRSARPRLTLSSLAPGARVSAIDTKLGGHHGVGVAVLRRPWHAGGLHVPGAHRGGRGPHYPGSKGGLCGAVGFSVLCAEGTVMTTGAVVCVLCFLFCSH